MTGKPRLLSTEPLARPESLSALLGLANAIETESVARYTQLAALMEQRGEPGTAAVFHRMREIEERHVDMVGRRAQSLRQALPPAAEFTWWLPPEVAGSWDDVQHSALLTPYRALAIAVTNEERAFTLYSYIAARADDRDLAQEAETLAREELAHAAELRVLRRRAYHREGSGREIPAAPAVTALPEFRILEQRLARGAATALFGTAKSLEALGDGVSAKLVAGLAQREADVAANGDVAPAAAAAPGARGPAALLQDARRPLESASEIFEDVIAKAEREDLLSAAQTSLHRIVQSIAALGRRLSELEAPGDDAER
ncbi:MAG: ferritin family protein [Kiloniellaceae bacterium]